MSEDEVIQIGPEYDEMRTEASPGMYESERNLNFLSEMDEVNYDMGGNSWSEEVTKTVVKWKDEIAKNSFVYGVLLDKKEFYMQGVLIFTLILSVLMTILSGISIALSTLDVDINFQWVIFTFNIIILVASGVITVLNGVVKIFSWDDQIKIFTKIIEKLDTQWFVFETELNIPSKQRQNAKDFIKRMDGEYMHLMQICPHIGVDEYIKANKSYQESLSNDLIWQHRFRKEIEDKLKVH